MSSRSGVAACGLHLSPAALAALALASCEGGEPTPSRGDLAELEVQRIVEAGARAVYRGDVDAVLATSHPVVIRMLGGMDRARDTLKKTLEPILSIGMSIESFAFPRPPEFLDVGERRFVIVPTLTVLTANGARVESLNFQFGVLEPGALEWKFVEGSRLNDDNVHRLFPDFPPDYVFPEIYRKRL